MVMLDGGLTFAEARNGWNQLGHNLAQGHEDGLLKAARKQCEQLCCELLMIIAGRSFLDLN